MRSIKKLAIALIILFGVGMIFVEIMFIGERLKSHFSSYSEAKESGIMDRGWIPTFIPKSAININEQYDLDTNWVKMDFQYTPVDVNETRVSCQSEKEIQEGLEFIYTYLSNQVTIKLYNNGKAELHSVPN